VSPTDETPNRDAHAARLVGEWVRVTGGWRLAFAPDEGLQLNLMPLGGFGDTVILVNPNHCFMARTFMRTLFALSGIDNLLSELKYDVTCTRLAEVVACGRITSSDSLAKPGPHGLGAGCASEVALRQTGGGGDTSDPPTV